MPDFNCNKRSPRLITGPRKRKIHTLAWLHSCMIFVTNTSKIVHELRGGGGSRWQPATSSTGFTNKCKPQVFSFCRKQLFPIVKNDSFSDTFDRQFRLESNFRQNLMGFIQI